jgi:hypothetical protein
VTAVSCCGERSGAHQLKPGDRGSLGQSRVWHLDTGPRDTFSACASYLNETCVWQTTLLSGDGDARLDHQAPVFDVLMYPSEAIWCGAVIGHVLGRSMVALDSCSFTGSCIAFVILPSVCTIQLHMQMGISKSTYVCAIALVLPGVEIDDLSSPSLLIRSKHVFGLWPQPASPCCCCLSRYIV